MSMQGNSRELMDRAIHCLDSGQPNLAGLYMVKARQVLQQEREEIFRRRMQLAAIKAVRPVLQEFQRIWEEAGPQVQQALNSYSESVAAAAKAVEYVTEAMQKGIEAQQARQDSIVRRRDNIKWPKPPSVTQTFGKPPSWHQPRGHLG